MADSEIKMPQLGETVTEGTILKWLKAVGDTVAKEEPLYEISTEKVDAEVPSPASGVLKEILIKEGEDAEVGVVLGILDVSEDAPAEEPSDDAPKDSAAPEKETTEAEAEDTPKEAPAQQKDEKTPKTPKTPKKLPKKSTAKGTAVTSPSDELLKDSSPLVRKMIRDLQVDASLLIPTGKGGRLTRRDVEVAHAASNLLAQRVGGGRAGAPIPQRFRSDPQSKTSIPLSRIRKVTAEHMLRSKSVSPHVLTAMEVDFESVELTRQKYRPVFKEEEGFSLTYLPFIIRAVCDAIAEYPHINASVGEEELTVFNYVNMDIAVDLNFEGLLAPVIKDADTKTLRELAAETVDLANRARGKKIQPDDLSGGTFTITNPGQYGTLMQFPLINQPQVAILSTDGIKRKPVVIKNERGEESIAIHSVGVLALAWDHRAFDGAYVAAFLDHLRSIIENRDWGNRVLTGDRKND